jgi:hypothetical protein
MTLGTSIEIRDHLVHSLESDLIGPVVPEVPDEVLAFAPSRFYLCGFLAPEGHRDVTPDEEDDELDAVPDAKAGIDLDEKEGEVKERRLFPASMGLSVLLPPAGRVSQLRAILSWAEYLRSEDAPPPAEPETAAPPKKKGTRPKRTRPTVRWTRHPRGPVEVTVPLDARALRSGLAVPGSAGLQLVGELSAVPDMRNLPTGTRALSLFLVNRRTPAAETERQDEAMVFQVSLALECEAPGFQARSNVLGEEADNDPDDRVADLQFRGRKEYAVGHGVAVKATAGEPVTRVETTFLPRAAVHRVEPRQLGGVTAGMDDLGALADGAGARAALSGIGEAYAAWIDERQKEVPGLSSKPRRAVAGELLDNARRARARIDAGVVLLERDPQALLAFRLMNRAMAEAARRRPGRRPDDPPPAWRLFQLAFVLLNLPSLVDPTHDDRNTVELIFFPTGGGKTEAYLGVIAFLLLHRRLTRRARPDAGLGVAVILRYTLRLLTLDQLGRAATLICALERLRQARPAELGEVRFAIGLWVGKSATENTLKDAAEKIAEYKDDDSPNASSPFPLTGCPWCGTELDHRAFTVVGAKGNPDDLRVACVADGCDFSTARDASGLPVLFVDEQIYQELPCFVIATVDKFAMMPWRGETAGFFGKIVRARQGRRFFSPTSGAAPKGATALPDGLLPPDLIVQDELHLISGPLGTMVGLYETAIEHLAARPGPRRPILPRIIASTATVRRARAQIQALYGRDDLALFPPPGLDDRDSFFAVVDDTGPARLYAGVAASGRAMKGILLRVYVALLGAAERGGAESLAAADPYLTLVGYFNSLRELGGMRRLVEDEVVHRAASIEDRRPEGTAAHPWVKNRTVSRDVVELTSRRTTGQIAREKKRLETPATTQDRVDVCLASNMISVGVDIARLGLMVMAGQPKTSAEYIQASSRVGRKVDAPGLVVTVLNLAKPRDRSHHERFVAYHESFYREVEATSVTPFADPALARGMAGALVAMTRLGDPELLPSASVRKLPARKATGEAALRSLVARAGAQPRPVSEAAVRHAGQAILDAWEKLALEDEPRRYSSLEKTAKGKALLFSVLDAEDRDDDEKRFAAPTSMRDVEPSAHLWVRDLPRKRSGAGDDGEA